MHTLKTMLKYAFRNRWLWLAGIFMPAVFSAATNIYLANTLQDYVELVSGDHVAAHNVVVTLLMALAVLLLFSCLDDLGLLARSLLPAIVESRLRADCCRKLIRTPLKNLRKFRTGELLTRYTTDVELCARIAVNDISGVVYPLIAGTGYALAVFFSGTGLGLIMLGLGVSVILLNFIFVPKLKSAQKNILQAKEAYTSECVGALHGKMTIRQYSAGETMSRRIREAADRIREKEYRAVSLRALKALTSDALAESCIYLLTPLACILAAYSYMDLSTVLFLDQLCRCFIVSTQNFATAFVNYKEHKLSFERISEVLLLPKESEERETGIPEVSGEQVTGTPHTSRGQESGTPHTPRGQESGTPDASRGQESGTLDAPRGQESGTLHAPRGQESGTPDASPRDGSVTFDHVSVSYEGRQVLNGISFHISPGECVCIRGGSGSGKSTLAKALMQMVDYQGEISIGGKNCKELPLDALRKQIAFSPEHSDLFCTSVYENILFGNPTAQKEAVYRAADKAAVTDTEAFLGREAGKCGELLSGGQRQRVSIARALLRDAPIFILDEPTAALDTESETRILQTISGLKQEGKCILLITHKESTMDIADRILEL